MKNCAKRSSAGSRCSALRITESGFKGQMGSHHSVELNHAAVQQRLAGSLDIVAAGPRS